MSATGKQMNWSAVGFTPTSGSLLPWTSVDGVDIDPGGQLLTYSGSADVYPTLAVNQMNNPTVTVRVSNPAEVQSLSAGTTGVWTGTNNDAKLASLGAIVYTMINAVIQNTPSTGNHAAFSTAVVTLLGFSADGVTSPLSFVRT